MISPVPGGADFSSGHRSFAVGLRPPDALTLSWTSVLDLLRDRHGPAVDLAISASASDPLRAHADLPEEIRSPRAGDADPSWLRWTNMAGINVRTVGDFAGVVKYSLTLPAAVDSIHLLPIWEPGAVGSLYGIASWNLNTEFVSEEMRAAAPHLDTPARQLRALSNLLHLTGRTLGMDVIPHTDRFSEPTLANPDLFEWMRIERREIVEVGDPVTESVRKEIIDWFARAGAVGDRVAADELFEIDEASRLAAMFGSPADVAGRTDRRVDLLRHVKLAGLEPVPATMGVPFRGIEIDPDVDRVVVDDGGLEWPDFVFTRPESMSRVFSPLTRFHLYESDGESMWGLDFDRPRHDVWRYVCEHYATAQQIGCFDFMRGDMAHVQMRPDGVPDVVDDHYDILRAVKARVAESADAPWFAYFAESFLPARDVFQYGEEMDHLEASLADATLGDLQSTPVGSADHLRMMRRYLDDLATRATAPAYTVMTADKDDPRFDEFYLGGNEVRMFTSLFLPDMPSYTGLGFELRDRRTEPVENERYTKLFVFHESGESNIYPSKARFGTDYIWGSNVDLFDSLTRIRLAAEDLLADIGHRSTRWLIPPDATGLRGTVAWLLDTEDDTEDGAGDGFVFVANYDLDDGSGYFGVPGLDADTVLHLEFSTAGPVADLDGERDSVDHNGVFHRIENLDAGEGRIYRIAVRTSARDS